MNNRVMGQERPLQEVDVREEAMCSARGSVLGLGTVRARPRTRALKAGPERLKWRKESKRWQHSRDFGFILQG